MASTMPKTSDMYDLTILYMSDVTNWCEYLFDIFNPFEVYQQSEEITEFPTHEMTLQNIKNSRVQVLIISPKFIETVTHQISEITGKNSVVGLLCGVEESELPRLKDRVPEYTNWHLVDARQGPKCITQTTLSIVDDMIKCSNMPDNYPDTDTCTYVVPVTSAQDDVYLPMTARHSSRTGPAVSEELYIHMAGHSLDSDRNATNEDIYLPMDDVQSHVESGKTCDIGGEELYLDMEPGKIATTCDIGGEELYLDMEQVNPRLNFGNEENTYDMEGTLGDHQGTYDRGTLPNPGSKCIVIPDKVRSGVREKVHVIFQNTNLVPDSEGSYQVRIQFGNRKSEVLGGYVNPYTLKFESPRDLPAGSYKCQVIHNGLRKGPTFRLVIRTSMSVLSDILMDSLQPLNFVCEAFGISPADSNQLDNLLHEHCSKHMPAGGFKNLLPINVLNSSTKQNTEFPTPLHFAAKFGLRLICATLSQWPGADQALRMKNVSGLTPEQMASDDDIKNLLNYSKERSISSSHDSGNVGYVIMKHDKGPKPSNGSEATTPKSTYDRPFRVAIPATQTPHISKDEDLQKLVSGDVDDIYNYYDSWPDSSEGLMIRDEDDEEDDGQTVPEPVKDYEKLESDQPTCRLDSRPPDGPRLPRRPETQVEPQVASRRPTAVTRENKDSNSTKRSPDPRLQSLIDIQEKVKNAEITLDQAVVLFKQWEQDHDRTNSQPGRDAPGGEKQGLTITSRILRRLHPPTSRALPESSRNKLEQMLRTKMVEGMSPPPGQRGPRSDPDDRSDRVINGNTSASCSRTSLTSSGSGGESAYGSATETDQDSEAPPSDLPPQPPRSPRPINQGRGDQPKRFSQKLDQDFSVDYLKLPIPPIPPRNTSTSAYPRMLPGAQPVLRLTPDTRRRDTDIIPEHDPAMSEHLPSNGIPNREAPPPPRRSSQDNNRGPEGRRQSDPSIIPREADSSSSQATSPSYDTTGRTKRPVPRPRVPRPRP